MSLVTRSKLISKSTVIRLYLEQFPDADANSVATFLQKNGMSVHKTLIQKILIKNRRVKNETNDTETPQIAKKARQPAVKKQATLNLKQLIQREVAEAVAREVNKLFE